VGGVAATVITGAGTGIYPAWRSARPAPTEALGTP